MDKFAPYFYEKGFLQHWKRRTLETRSKKAIKQSHGLYFTAFWGIACFLSERVEKKDLVAFEDLGTEAIYNIFVNDLPLRVNFC